VAEKGQGYFFAAGLMVERKCLEGGKEGDLRPEPQSILGRLGKAMSQKNRKKIISASSPYRTTI